MKLLQVNYERALARDNHDQAIAMREAATHLAELSGLIWKMWLYDDDLRVAGGLYLFDTEANARGWGDGPMVASLCRHPGIGGVEFRYFDIDVALSELTRAGSLLRPVPAEAEPASGGAT
ncbi:YdhR family protein [Gordonia rhizosphera]|uniref:Uncharacterized protein n=1 Tax=Gordonia rhizosphera NBRC 16068 TaxID=1108045 RepID=K6WB54_9ACTN|nr:YdhR family protein [Gordonia rhizosphera]GAB89422.1 hypothetical protein GORHZ_061_00050 [Gordonia rhizosphera NBRC 16068]